jgi:uncharacterized protein
MTRETMKGLFLTILFLIPGCGGCGKPSPKEYFSDPDVVALAKAASKGDVKTIDRLVSNGVDVNAKGKDNVTTLFFALNAKNKVGFKRLLELKADPNLQAKSSGESVVSLAAKIEDDSEWLELALKHGGNPDVVDPTDVICKNQTPLFNANYAHNLKNVELLIAAGANVNHQDACGETPAMNATDYRWYRGVYRLLQAGADVRIKNVHGQDLAFQCYMSGPPMSATKYPEDFKYYHKVLAFLRDKGVDLDAAKRSADKHMGRN